MKLKIIILIFCFFIANLSAQNVKTTELPINRVLEVDKPPANYWDLIIPCVRGHSDKVFINAGLDSMLSMDLPQYYIDWTNKRMEEKNVKNDYTPVSRKVVFKNGKEIVTKEYQTYFKYIYQESCGYDLIKTIMVKDLTLTNPVKRIIMEEDQVLSTNLSDLLGVFSTNVVNKECSSRYIEIKEPNKSFLIPNKRYEVGDYIIEHKATIWEISSYDVYVNVELSITNKKENKSQILLKTPYQDDNGFVESILISDINCDSIDDIIITVTSDTELCWYRLFYVSTRNSDSLLEYIGYSEDCECP